MQSNDHETFNKQRKTATHAETVSFFDCIDGAFGFKAHGLACDLYGTASAVEHLFAIF